MALIAPPTYRISIGAALVTLVMLVPGCGNSGNGGNGDGSAAGSSATATATTGASWNRPDSPPDPQTLLRAGDTAVAKVPGTTLTFIESETNDAGTWKVRMVAADGAEQQLKIGTDGVTVLVGPTLTSISDADKAKLHSETQAAQLDYRAAVDKMLAAVPSGSITRLNLTDSNGTTVWQAQVWDTYLVEHDVTVNAVNGDLVANKQV